LRDAILIAALIGSSLVAILTVPFYFSATGNSAVVALRDWFGSGLSAKGPDVISPAAFDREQFETALSVVLGYAILSSPAHPSTICETISRAFSLSSAGTTYQGA
jgi:hypothetical protein